MRFIPVLYLFILLLFVLIYLLTHKAKVIQIYDRLDDTVTVSIQAVCIPDRYIPGTYHWDRQDAVFDSGSRGTAEYYGTNPEIATKYAAELSYGRLKELLSYNLPSTTNGYRIAEYVLVNVISGTAYKFDMINNLASMQETNETESYLQVKIEVDLDLPLFGKTSWSKETVAILTED